MGSEVCSTCGLPDELCVCEDVAKSDQELEVTTDERRFGKMMTIVSGLNASEMDVGELASDLKSEFACGGTISDGDIHLQGDHTDRIVSELETRGFSVV